MNILRTFLRVLALGLGLGMGWMAQATDPLALFQYEIVGTRLAVSPSAVSVPKGIPGSVLVEVVGNTALAQGAYVEAILRGPSFPARRLLGRPGEALVLPPLPLVGSYRLDAIRLVDAATGEVRLEGTPGSVPITVFDEVLVTRVETRPLSLDEIREKGIAIDENNFRAVEFEVGFVLDGETIPVRFPVVAPRFVQTTEIIPTAELEARLAEAAAFNRQLASLTELPEELLGAELNIELQGVNFQVVDPSEDDLALRIPPIPALLMIPGNIGYLNQFFSVQVFTENGSPAGSGLNVINVQAELVLPKGPDQVAAASYGEPGDDPLRFARVGPDAVIESTQPVVGPGGDGKLGTSDDNPRLAPGEEGQAEFLVEGLQEGLHIMDLDLTADLEGLAAGVVRVKGKAAGAVLVRNPKFSMAFTHPRTVRAGEPYEASVTLLNTGSTDANLVSVRLSAASLSGGVLESEESVDMGTIRPGGSATARFRIRAQRTGEVTFSNLTTGDDAVAGRFQLSMGIDERGVALSPDTLLLPDYVDELPEGIRTAATRVLGQALSIATAPQLPADVLPVTRQLVKDRAVELAEAGQRIRYGDSLPQVLVDLAVDWQGARDFSEGFDQLMRETDAGLEWRDAVALALSAADGATPVARLGAVAADLAGRGETHTAVADSLPPGDADFEATIDDGVVASALSTVEQALVYDHTDGRWFARVGSATGVATWRLLNAVATGGISLGRFLPTGTGTRDEWTLPALAAGAVLTLDMSAEPPVLAIDDEGDGTVDRSLAADARESVAERAPAVVAVIQDMAVEAGRPLKRCPVPELANYGTVVAVLFNKPMSQEAVDVPAAYVLDNGNVAYAVQIQPGGRVALLSLRQPVGGLVERTLTLSGIVDSRGNALGLNTAPVQTDFAEGVRIQGRAVRADGSPAAGIPVTLTYYDESENELLGSCDVVVVRTSQVTTDDSGGFSFDMVLAGIQYVISATDTFGLSEEAVALIVSGATEQDQLRSRLLEIAAGNPNSLLAAFAVASLPEAVAAAEGLDRAVLRDRVDEDSPRVGSTVPVALRFRGRAAVEGTVLLSDGTTPASGAAVNLFPDPTSRELGRGVFADGLGRFTFFGVPLGNFTVKADTIGGLTRTIAGAVSEPGTTNTISVVLSSTNAPRVAFGGTVLESDGVTPHGGASVYMGRLDGDRMFDIVAAVTADAEGSWVAEDVPAGTYDFLAISTDNQRTAKRQQVEAVSGTTTVHLTLTGTAVVVGRVETSAGRPVENALVAGGETLVRTDVNGAFRLTGVPVGERTISAGVERDADAGWDFPRIGSGRLTVLPGEESFVVIRLREAGRIIGRVLDADGVAVPNARVAIPQESGFQWVNADSTGRYAFEGMPLDAYTLSAPAPPAVEKDTQGLVDQLEDNPTEDQIEAIIAEAYALFTGASDPFLNGEGASFDPEGWGYVETALTFDGETAVADIRFLPKGTVSGTVVNGQSVPIGAAVRLTGVAPQSNGAPGFRVRGDVNSDPATGYFEFVDALFIGNWGLQAASPFFPTVITTSGNTTSTERDVAGVVLQFPPTREVNGRLAGIVYQPDGVTPAGEGVRVQISFGDDYVITTEEGGVYDTRANLPATDAGGRPGVVYTLRAEDPSTGYRGESVVRLLPGVTNQSSVTLIAKGGLVVTVLQADGSPADGATVDVRQGSYPQDQSDGVAGVDGTVTFGNLFAGSYAVSAQMLSGPTRIYGRASVQVTAGEIAAVTVVLQPTATIVGRYLKRDLVTPVGFAQIAVGNVGFTTSDEEGLFTVTGLPLGTYRITSSDPVTGRGAQTTVTLSTSGATNEVSLVEQSLGSIEGVVINSQRTGGASGATVLLSVDDGLSSPQAVTTGPDGTFSFPSVAAGNYRIVASDALTGLSAQVTGTLAEDVTLVTVEIVLPAVATVEVAVVDPDGVTPAGNTRVTLSLAGVETVSDTDDAGLVTFSDLPLGTYSVVAQSLAVTNSSSVASGSVTLAAAGSTHAVVLVLSGTGIVRGTVVDSDGVTPVPGVVVSLTVQDGVLAGNEESTLTDGAGTFEFLNVPVAALRLTAIDEALAGSESVTLASHGDMAEVTLVLGDSGTVVGRLLRADGVTPVRNEEVVITFESQSGLPGRDFTTSDSLGRFEFGSIPLGTFTLSTVAAAFDGIAGGGGTLAVNGETVDVGDLVLDEDDPRVVVVEPVDGASEVSTTTVVTLDFNEALDPDTVRADGIFLRTAAGQAVDATVALQAHPDDGVLRRVVLTPEAPLASETTHQVVVIDGERQDALGGVTGVGPSDRVGRILVAPFLATFTTRDDDPPGLLSVFPAQGEVQVDIRSVIRLTFDEAMDPTSVTLGMTGPGGAVEGTVTTVLGDTVFLFTPTAALSPNANYTISGAGFRDVAGNAATGDPFTFTFATLDTLGPVVASLGLADGALPISGAAVELEAVLATSEPGASVRFSADLVVLGIDTASPFRWPLTLPSMGSVVYRATAIDAYGNEGESVEYALTVVDGTDPELTLVSPAESAVLDPEAPLVLAYQVADNSFGVSMTATLSGAVEATDSVEVVLTPGVVSEGSSSFSLTGVPLGGGEVEVVLTAVDVAGNASSVTRTFRVPDREPPQLVSAVPADGTTTVSPWLESVVLTFSEAMDPATVDTNRLQFFAGTEVLPLNITLSEDGRTATLAWDGLLEQGTGHTNRILAGMTDLAGNALVLDDGTAWPELGSNAVFTTASMIVGSPIAGDPVIPGMSVDAQVAIGSGFGADTVRFLLNDGDTQDVSVSDLDTEASVTWTLPADATAAVVRIQALRAGRESIEFEPIVLGFQPSEGDTDGDGWLNGYEFSRGMDPFVADGADDDFDGDGLNNGGELALGGDPADPDTDDDGLGDAEEAALGTGLADADSDDDGFGDAVDARPLTPAVAPQVAALAAIEVVSGLTNTVLVNATDGDSNLVALVVSGPGLSATWASGGTTNVFPETEVVTRELQVTGTTATTSSVVVVAVDGDGLRGTNTFEVVVLRDLDGDTIADRDDPDIDGDGLANEAEVALGGDPEDPDTDDDGLGDTAEVALGTGLADADSDDDGFGDAVDARPLTPAVAPQVATLAAIEVVSGLTNTVLVNATDGDSNLVALVVSGPGLSATWASGGTTNAFPEIEAVTLELQVTGTTATTSSVVVVAVDGDGLRGTNTFEVVVLRDLDGDAIADRDDPDIDGDGLANEAEVALGGDPEDPDTDDDGLSDAAEAALGTGLADADSDDDGFGDAVDARPLTPAVAPQVAALPAIEVVSGLTNKVLVNATDGDSNLVALVVSGPGLSATWASGGTTNAFPEIEAMTLELQVTGTTAATSSVVVVAVDGDGLRGTNTFEVVVLRDLDGDAIADRDDPDIDGDGLANEAEVALGGDPEDPDTDDDGLGDAAEAALGTGLADADSDEDGFGDAVDARPLTPAVAPQVAALPAIEVVSGLTNTVLVNATDGDSNLVALVVFGPGLSATWASGGTTNAFPETEAVTLELQVTGTTATTSSVVVVAVDGDGLRGTNTFEVVVLRDLDGDAIADRDDPDIDGDGLANEAEVALGGDPEDPDTDDDGLGDTAEVALGTGLADADSDDDGFGDAVDARPLTPAVAPQVAALAAIEVVSGLTNTVLVNATDGDSNLVTLVVSGPGLSATWASGGTTNVFPETEAVALELHVTGTTATTSSVVVVAVDGDGLRGTNTFEVVVLRDLDGDTIADRDDPDIDGDGLANEAEVALGGDPEDPDTDDDGLGDAAEVALGTGLADPDSDDDTLLDGVDPEPLFSALGIDFVGVESVRIREGHQTNLLFVVESRVGPVALVDFVRTEAVPGYVGFDGLSVTNTATNGVVQVQLRLLPLHDAAGTNRVVLLAGTASGVTNTHTIEVVIEDDPMLQTTTWVGGSGAWSDAANWSDGVPDFDHVAVIDSVGTAEITLDVVPSARALLMDSSDAVLKPGLNLTSTVPMEVRLGVVALDNNREMVLAAPAVIAGTVRLASQSTGSRLSAFGAVNLRGRLEVTGDAPLMGGTARVGGRWFLEQSSLVDLAPDARMALVGGTQWIQAGGMVLDAASRFDVSLTDPAMHRMALGSSVTGEGVFAVEGPALLQVYGDVPVASEVRVGSMGRVQGQGRLVLRGPHRLEGQFDAGVVAAGASSGTINNALFREPVALSETANWAVNGARFDDGIHVGPGAVLSAAVGWSLRIGAASTNEGRILLGAGSAGSILEGTGTLVNLGRIEVVMLPVDLGTPARLALPILVAPGGVFDIGAGASVSMDQGSGLTVEGQLQVAGTLRLENRTPAPALTIADGGSVDGSGTVQVDGANVVTLHGSWGSGVALRGSSTGSFEGSGSLVLANNSLLAGTFRIPVTLDAGAGGTAEAAVFDGGLIVKSGAVLDLRGVRLANGSRVETGGNATVVGGTTLTLDGVLEVDGLLALTSQGVGSTLAGAGEVHVDGLVEVNSTPPVFGVPAVLGVPIQVNTTGRLRVLEGALASVPAGGRVSASGLVDLRPTGSLDLAAGTPAPTLTVMTFGQIFGGGRLGLNGESRFTLHGQWDPTLTLGTAAGTVVNGIGALRLGGTQNLLGTFQLPVTVEAGGVVGMSTASVEQALTVESGASLTVSGPLTTTSDVWLKPGATAEVGGGVFWTLQGAVTNQGQLRLNSQASGSVLTGEGTLHQLGSVTVAATAPLFGVGASVRVPVVTAFGASWTLDPDAILLLEDGATDVAMGGPLTLGAGSVLRLTPEGSGRRLSFENGASVSGSGTVELSGPNMVVIASPLTVTHSEIIANNAGGFLGLGAVTLVGTAELHVMTSLGLPADLNVAGLLTVDPSVVLQIPGTLTLEPTGAIHNSGTIETVAFGDLGGTYTGTLPVVTGGGAPMAFLIDGIELGGVATPSGRSASGGADPGRQVRLFWTAPTDGPFLVEVTSDFVNWQIVTTQSAAVGGRRYRAIVPAPGSNQSFYRVRRWEVGP